MSNIMSETQRRIQKLEQELSTEIATSKRSGKIHQLITDILMTITLLSSAIAGIGGIFLSWDAKLTGGLALIPGIIGLMAGSMKFQPKAAWFYRLEYAVERLQRKLLYQLPETPTIEQIGTIAESFSKLLIDAQKEWQRDLAISFSFFKRHP